MKKQINPMVMFFIGAMLAFVIGIIAIMGFGQGSRAMAKSGGHEEVCFCHNYSNNPVTICVDKEADIHAHDRHVRDGKDLRGECPKPTETPTPTNTPVPTETPEPTPEPTKEPEPTPTVEPTPTETPEPIEEKKQETQSVSYTTPSCPSGMSCKDTCTIPVKPATAIGGERLSDDAVRFSWHPSTDPHDKQAVLYGPSANQLLYSILDLPGDTGFYDVNIYDMGHWYFQVMTWRGECVSFSSIVDP